MSQIEVIGIGLDGVAGLTEKMKLLIEQANLLVGSNRHLSYFSHNLATKLVLEDVYQGIIELRRRLENNSELQVVIIVSGDPLFFGLGRLLLEKFPSEKLRFHPYISSMQLAFNRVQIPWHDAKFVSAHGRSLEELTKLLQQGIEKIGILTDKDNNPHAIAELYLALDLPMNYSFWVCENLGAETEKIHFYSVEKIKELAYLKTKNFAPLNVVILQRQEERELKLITKDNLPLIGLPERVFLSFNDRPGLMTKREIRLVILGELALKSGQVVWDIGAGTGAVSIEIARLCPDSQVYAIEKTASGSTLIEKNCQRLQVSNVISFHGKAPGILTQLPIPDRIFIGGSGGNLLEILDLCESKLVAQGVLVLALATLENLNLTLNWFKGRSWTYHLLQLQINRSTYVGEFTRFYPLNPVTILTAQKVI